MLATQVLATLVDFIQGPNKENQGVLMRAGVVEVFGEWCPFVQREGLAILHDILSHNKAKGHARRPSRTAEAAEDARSELFDAVSEVELGMLELLYAELDSNGDPALVESLLRCLQPKPFIEHFAVLWRAVILCSDDEEREKWFKASSKMMRARSSYPSNGSSEPRRNVYDDERLREQMQMFKTMPEYVRERRVKTTFHYYVLCETLEQQIREHKQLSEERRDEVRYSSQQVQLRDREVLGFTHFARIWFTSWS